MHSDAARQRHQANQSQPLFARHKLLGHHRHGHRHGNSDDRQAGKRRHQPAAGDRGRLPTPAIDIVAHEQRQSRDSTASHSSAASSAPARTGRHTRRSSRRRANSRDETAVAPADLQHRVDRQRHGKHRPGEKANQDRQRIEENRCRRGSPSPPSPGPDCARRKSSAKTRHPSPVPRPNTRAAPPRLPQRGPSAAASTSRSAKNAAAQTGASDRDKPCPGVRLPRGVRAAARSAGTCR